MNTRDLNVQGVHRAVFGGQVQITERAGEDGGEPVKVYTFVASTEQPARDDHILLQNWDLTNYAANPVILYGHDHDVVVGRGSNLRVATGPNGARALLVDVELDEGNPDVLIQRIVHQVKRDFLRSVSVSWITNSAKRRSSYPSDSPFYEEDSWGYVIGEEKPSELLEISIASVPSDANALAQRSTKRQLTEAEIRAIIRDERVNGDAPEADGFPSGFFSAP